MMNHYQDLKIFLVKILDWKNNFQKLVKGDDIRKYYDEKSYAYQKGQLGNSCMKNSYCQDFFGIYVENPDVCNLLVYLNSDGALLGRALIWKLSKSPCDATYFMDRIYTTADSDILKFKKYAEEKEWMTKYKQNCDVSDNYFFEYKGDLFIGEVNAKLSKYEFDKYPFLDTLSNLTEEDGIISNLNSIGSFELTDTTGDTTMCYDCGGSGVFESYCDDCDGQGSVECDKCYRAAKKDKKSCVKCNGDGSLPCKTCNGKGETQEECDSCVGLYKTNLKEISRNDPNSKLRELATKELERLEIKSSS